MMAMMLNDPLLSAEKILYDENCKVKYEIYKDFQHIKSDKTDRILGSIGEFCAAFYHVPSFYYNPHNCLDQVKCKVGKNNTVPRSVVALVKYKMHDGSDIIVRYSNHYMRGKTKHAEEFFSDDIRNLTSSSLVPGKKLKKITMYITFQPCHFSTIHARNKSCCNVLLRLLDHPRLDKVKIWIKPTHIYTAGKRHPDLVRKGKEGIKLLMARGVEIARMRIADWKFLCGLVYMNDGPLILPYSKSSRETLDKEIDNRLQHLNSGSSGSSSQGLGVVYHKTSIYQYGWKKIN